MEKKEQVFTPDDYVIELLNIVEYRDSLFGKKILENSCGDGQILKEVVKRYIEDCRKNHIADEEIIKGLSEDLYGFEIDNKQIKKCVSNLDKVARQYKLYNIHWNIHNLDFLRWKSQLKFDYVVGNPPYITYRDLKMVDRQFVRENFKTCQYGKFDYYYAFVEKSINMLKESGKMSYLIPSSIFKTVFGKELRNFILPHLKAILDFSDVDVFENALVKSSILYLEKNSNLKTFRYEKRSNNIIKQLIKARLEGKWQFSSFENNKKNRFGDFYKVSHSVATLYNKAFVLKDNITINDNGQLFVEGILLENDLIRIAYSPRSVCYNKQEKIIFPYETVSGNIKHIKEDKLKTKYPGVFKYLRKYYAELLRRKSDKTAQWFEYGRSQAINNLNCSKLLLSTVVTHQLNIAKIGYDSVPYSGLFIRAIDEEQFSLDRAMSILKSSEFFEYVKQIGIPINGQSFRITSRDIENYKF
ncbi:Eco57I restriction-modification methylase [Streptococcus sp. AS20]|uniref:Eco57I restriction-modification methylase domain-containing protein n=1 Tax=Streptococcus sp. AS20 TaxID=936578 RepID=UPI000445C935|nr:N-6 DNA methylase [Streptococcus sp. AS20]EUB24523.1 Eco57I restriction-modification methylase [Streptococcus sp. AS20]